MFLLELELTHWENILYFSETGLFLYDYLQLHPFSWKWYNFILCVWKRFHCVYMHFIYPSLCCWMPRFCILAVIDSIAISMVEVYLCGMVTCSCFLCFFLNFMYMSVCLHTCLPHTCLLPSDARRGCQISWDWSYRWLWGTLGARSWTLVLSTRAVSV